MIYCKSGYLHMGEIYTSFVVRLKPRKMPPGVYGKKKQTLCEVNDTSKYLIPTHIVWLQKSVLLYQLLK